MTDKTIRLSINNQDLAEAFFSDSHLLGIMASVKDYMFCGELNKLLDMDFRINNDLEISLKKKDRYYYFPIFEYHVPCRSLSHFLYTNQYDGEYLLPEFKHLDFLWLMKDDWVSDEELRHFIAQVKAMPGVQLVIDLTNQKIKNKENLVF